MNKKRRRARRQVSGRRAYVVAVWRPSDGLHSVVSRGTGVVLNSISD